jgi:curved DNA-binding protein CbpA
MSVKDPYRALGLSPQCSLEEIRQAYKKKALICHPDKNPAGEEQFKQITQAYDLLSDPVARARYDRERQSQHAMPFGARSSAGSSMRHMSTSEALFRDRQDAKAAKRYAEEIIRNDKKAQSSKSLKELLREQEEMRRAGEEQRRMATDQGRTQAQKVNSMQEKFAHLNVPGVQWKKEYEQFTAEEERERRQIVAQLIAESDEDTDDILLYRYYVSASDIIIGRRGYIWE